MVSYLLLLVLIAVHGQAGIIPLPRLAYCHTDADCMLGRAALNSRFDRVVKNQTRFNLNIIELSNHSASVQLWWQATPAVRLESVTARNRCLLRPSHHAERMRIAREWMEDGDGDVPTLFLGLFLLLDPAPRPKPRPTTQDHVRPTESAPMPNSAGSWVGGHKECAHFTHFKVKKEYQKLFVECMVIFWADMIT